MVLACRGPAMHGPPPVAIIHIIINKLSIFVPRADEIRWRMAAIYPYKSGIWVNQIIL